MRYVELWVGRARWEDTVAEEAVCFVVTEGCHVLQVCYLLKIEN